MMENTFIRFEKFLIFQQWNEIKYVFSVNYQTLYIIMLKMRYINKNLKDLKTYPNKNKEFD